MVTRSLRRRCGELLDELDLAPPLDVVDLCSRLASLRGRPIRLVEHPIDAAGPFGFWVGTSEADYIVYPSDTARSHQDHIILHEVGHMIAGHRSPSPVDDAAGPTSSTGLAALFPDIDPAAVARALARAAYSDRQEREAETIATIIRERALVLEWSGRSTRRPATPLSRLEHALSDSPTWS